MTKFWGPVLSGVALASVFSIVVSESARQSAGRYSSESGGALSEVARSDDDSSTRAGSSIHSTLGGSFDGLLQSDWASISLDLVCGDEAGIAATTLRWTSADGRGGRSTSDADGRVELQVPAGADIVLSMADPRWTLSERQLAKLAPGEQRELGSVFPVPGQVLSGRVLGPDRQPLVDALVESRPNHSVLDTLDPGDAGCNVDLSRLVAVRTDDTGVFEMRGVAPGAYFLRASFEGLCRTGWETVAVPRSSSRAVDLVLHAGRPIRGQATDCDDSPVPGARIGAWSRDSRVTLAERAAEIAQTGRPASATGEFELTGLPLMEDVTLIVVDPTGALGIAIVGPAEDWVSLRLRSPARLVGRVCDGLQDPMPGARVQIEAWSDGPDSGLLYADVETDLEGRFQVDGLLPGPYRVVASCDAGRDSVGPVLAGPQSVPVELEVGGALRLTVRVLDGTRAPMEGIAVLLEPTKGPSPDPERSSIRVPTDSLGEARFLDVPDGSWVARVDPSVGQAGHALPVAVLVDRGRSQVVEILLRPAGAIALRVVDEDGCGVPRLPVGLSSDEGSADRPMWVETTDDYGYATWVGVPLGMYEIGSLEGRIDAVYPGDSDRTWSSSRLKLAIDSGGAVVVERLLLNGPTLHIGVRRRVSRSLACAWVGRGTRPCPISWPSSSAPRMPRRRTGEVKLCSPAPGPAPSRSSPVPASRRPRFW